MDNLFHIFELTKELIDDIRTRQPVAHFHDFEEIILLTHGSFEHFIDFTIETVSAPMACYVSMGKMHQLRPNEHARGWVINYKNEFIPDSKLHFYSQFIASNNTKLPSTECLVRFPLLCQIIMAEYQQESIDFNSIRHLLSALITMIDNERKRHIELDVATKKTQVSVFNTFLMILDENFRRDVGVGFYADKMNMSERNLNIICKNNFNKSVSEIIETRKLIEAKNLLIHSNKSISEIGYELGYNEKSYFTRVFRNRLEITPSDFRDEVRKLLNQPA